MPGRGDILNLWGSLITGYFSITERPVWGDGRYVYWNSEKKELPDDPDAKPLYGIYLKSLEGFDLLGRLLRDDEPTIRSRAAWVLACLQTKAQESRPLLEAQLAVEESGWVRAQIAFALGELGGNAALRQVLASDAFPAARCMAACELARTDPTPDLLPPLLEFLSGDIEGYESIRGAGGKSTGDAAYSVSYLPRELQLQAVPAICGRLDLAGSFDTMPFVLMLLRLAFETSNEPVVTLSDLQRTVLLRLVNQQELWKIGNLHSAFRHYGLPFNRGECAKLLGVNVVEDKPLAKLSTALLYAKMNFLEEARAGILEALKLDPSVMALPTRRVHGF